MRLAGSFLLVVAFVAVAAATTAAASAATTTTTPSTAQPPRRLLLSYPATPAATMCGAADGSPCCAKPSASPSSPPTCSDGLVCFYTPGTQDGTCRRVPADCGINGASCCPALYHTATSPPITGSTGALCKDQRAYCSGARGSPAFADMPYAAGVCLLNADDCGVYGKSCCVVTSSVSTNYACASADGKQQGYCARPLSAAENEAATVCTPCPSEAVAAADPQKYWGCPTGGER